jgi:hypothetical protein
MLINIFVFNYQIFYLESVANTDFREWFQTANGVEWDKFDFEYARETPSFNQRQMLRGRMYNEKKEEYTKFCNEQGIDPIYNG